MSIPGLWRQASGAKTNRARVGWRWCIDRYQALRGPRLQRMAPFSRKLHTTPRIPRQN